MAPWALRGAKWEGGLSQNGAEPVITDAVAYMGTKWPHWITSGNQSPILAPLSMAKTLLCTINDQIQHAGCRHTFDDNN